MPLELLVAVIKLIVSLDPPPKNKSIRKCCVLRERPAVLPNSNNNALTQREDLWVQEAYLPWDLLQALSQDHICV